MKQRVGLSCGLVACIAILAPTVCSAQGNEPGPAIDCSVDAYDGQRFDELYQASTAIAQFLCDQFSDYLMEGRLDTLLVRSRLSTFGGTAHEALNEAGVVDEARYASQFNVVGEMLSAFIIQDMRFPEFTVQRPSGFGDAGSSPFGLFSSIDNGSFEFDDTTPCGTLTPVGSCADILEDFGSAFNAYRSSYNRLY